MRQTEQAGGKVNGEPGICVLIRVQIHRTLPWEAKRMRNPMSAMAVLAALLVAACTTTFPATNTVPRPVSATAASQYYNLEVPANLEIKSVDFSATTFTEVSGDRKSTSSEVGGRAFVKVYAVHRTTGEHFLLLYEDVANRRLPVQVIRFVPGAERAQADSTR
jgi:hypothetical protein